MNKPDNYHFDYSCEKVNLCQNCFWSNGEQCIRQLLTEEDIEDIKTKKIKKDESNN